MSSGPAQGDVVWVNPDPTRGSEIAKPRPFVVVSVNQMNAAPIGLSIAVPLTRTDRGNPLHVRVDPPEGGLDETSFVIPEQLRTIAHERMERPAGRLRSSTLATVLRHCRMLLAESR